MNIATTLHSLLKPQPFPTPGASRRPQNPLPSPPSVRDSFQPSSEGQGVLRLLSPMHTGRGNDTFLYRKNEQTPTNRGHAIAAAASRALEASRAAGNSGTQELRSSGPLSNLLRNALPSSEQEATQHSPGPISGGALRFLGRQKDTVEGPRPLRRPPRNYKPQEGVTQYTKV